MICVPLQESLRQHGPLWDPRCHASAAVAVLNLDDGDQMHDILSAVPRYSKGHTLQGVSSASDVLQLRM